LATLLRGNTGTLIKTKVGKILESSKRINFQVLKEEEKIKEVNTVEAEVVSLKVDKWTQKDNMRCSYFIH
jgi:hypothetical protein